MNEIADYNISQPSSIGFSAFEAGRYPRTTGKAFEMLSARKHEIGTQPDSAIQYSLSSLVSPH